MAGLVSAVVSDEPERVRERLLPHVAHQLNTYRQAGAGRSVRPVTEAMLRDDAQAGRTFQATEVMTPDALVERIAEDTRNLPVRQVYFWLSVAGMPDDLVQRHLELLCGEVRPRLARLEEYSA